MVYMSIVINTINNKRMRMTKVSSHDQYIEYELFALLISLVHVCVRIVQGSSATVNVKTVKTYTVYVGVALLVTTQLKYVTYITMWNYVISCHLVQSSKSDLPSHLVEMSDQLFIDKISHCLIEEIKSVTLQYQFLQPTSIYL